MKTKIYLNVANGDLFYHDITTIAPIGDQWITIPERAARVVLASRDVKHKSELVLRGEVRDDYEYKLLKERHGFSSFTTASGDEVFWGIYLDEEHFVFGNNILAFFGHNTVGRVGIHKDRRLQREATVEYFMLVDAQKSSIHHKKGEK